MKKQFPLIAVVALVCGVAFAEPQPPQTYIVSTKVYFSPDGGTQQAIIDQINKTKTNIFVQAYSFTNKDIVKALVEANKRGVAVFVILDKSNRTDKYGVADFLTHFGVDTYIDDKHAIAHSKVIILDKETVITGSYNFTNAAEYKNAENTLIIRSSELADAYFANWSTHQKHSQAYQSRYRNEPNMK